MRTFEWAWTEQNGHDEGWDVATAWVVGFTKKSITTYIFCRRQSILCSTEGRQPEYQRRISRFDPDLPHRIFHSLAEFLNYQSDWSSRLQAANALPGLSQPG